MSIRYKAIVFNTAGDKAEILMALLSEWPFESFFEEKDKVTAYIPATEISTELLSFIDSLSDQYFHAYESIEIEDKNWNEVWESSFDPVAIDKDWYIYASFHQPPDESFKHAIQIAPRMAFGTGHHATTYMMLQAMASLDFKGKQVLDYGCGTGILSVAAAKSGAAEITGVDIQPESVENSEEHMAINKITIPYTFLHGGLELVSQHTYDIILANINLSVIEEHLEQLKAMLRPGGYLLLSGIMIYDKVNMSNRLHFAPLQILDQRERGEWIQITLQK